MLNSPALEPNWWPGVKIEPLVFRRYLVGMKSWCHYSQGDLLLSAGKWESEPALQPHLTSSQPLGGCWEAHHRSHPPPPQFKHNQAEIVIVQRCLENITEMHTVRKYAKRIGLLRPSDALSQGTVSVSLLSEKLCTGRVSDRLSEQVNNWQTLLTSSALFWTNAPVVPYGSAQLI